MNKEISYHWDVRKCRRYIVEGRETLQMGVERQIADMPTSLADIV